MSKFQFGDKVKVVNPAWQYTHGLKIGMVGVVVSDPKGQQVPLVLFKDYDQGHDGAHGGRSSNCTRKDMLYVLDHFLEPVVNLPMVVADPATPVKKAVKRRVYGVKKDGSLNPQSALVLKLLKEKGSLTGVEAAAVYRVRALPRRISDIKAAGHKISRVLSADVTGQRYARYYLAA